MHNSTTIKYKNTDFSKGFYQDLRTRINDYFANNKITPHANTFMWLKMYFILALWLGSYLGILFGNLSTLSMFLVICVHVSTHLLIPFNISHDASHGAFSENPKINNILSYSLALIGVSPYFWRISHNQEHHSYINVVEIDSNTQGYGILRFTPEDGLKKLFKFQHVYAIIIYCITSLNYVLLKELRMIKNLRAKGEHIPISAYLELISIKVGYYTYTIILPYLLLDVSLSSVLLFFLLGHFVLGVGLALVFQCGHFTEDAHYPEMEDRVIQDGWAVHSLRTTCDYASQSWLVTHLFGGINIHIPHHLFPKICHVHYKSLVPIIKQTATDHGIKYREYSSFSGAISSHFKLLKKLGHQVELDIF